MIEGGPRRGRRPRDHRLVLDGVFWIARTGSPWCDLHDHFGKWSSVYRQFRRWTLSGVWDVLLGWAILTPNAAPSTGGDLDHFIECMGAAGRFGRWR